MDITKKELDEKFVYCVRQYENTGKGFWDEGAKFILAIAPILFNEKGEFIKVRWWHIARFYKLADAVIKFIKSL